jgi:ribosomal protein S18 acetylase RimI-like enzyme
MIRDTVLEDLPFVIEWFREPGILKWYPLANEREAEDAAKLIVSYSPKKGALTALHEGVPCGVINLYLSPFEKLSKQALFCILIRSDQRGKGIGTKLILAIEERAKELGLETLHLEVYRGNPAIELYRRLGFVEYGVHPKFIKEGSEYIDKILMQKRIDHGRP